MPLVRMTREQAAEQFTEGLLEVAAAATRYRDQELYGALIKMGRAAESQGIAIVPHGGLFVPCPACDAVPGQHCINRPGHLLSEDVHPERVDLAARVIAGEAGPLPAKLSR
jgi:hypothetical protein